MLKENWKKDYIENQIIESNDVKNYVNGVH